MMRKLRNQNKSGFTLLEVMLAVAILAIASTMIMKGFISVMIISNNNNRFSKSGEDNYRRAMHDTLIRYATAGDQQSDVIDVLGSNSTSVTLEAHFNGSYVPNNIEEEQLALCVDVSAYVDESAPLFNEADRNAYTVAGDSEALDSSTVVNNRFAFFYDFGQYLSGIGAGSGGHIYRWGYVVSSDMPEGHENSCIENPAGDGYLVYGWYCFNKTHTRTVAGNEVPDVCRCSPLAYGVVSSSSTPSSEDET